VSEEAPRVIVADSHELLRQGIENLLRTEVGAEIVASASDGYTVLKQCRALSPDLLVMDLGITRPSGPDVIRRLRQSAPELKIIVSSAHLDEGEAFLAFSLGVNALIPRQGTASHFVSAFRSALLGYTCVPSDYYKEFINIRKNNVRTGNVYGLSARELEVLHACASGSKNSEVAEQLQISVRTVETHRYSIYKKTECKGVEDLIKIASHI